MARIALLCIVTLAFVASTMALPHPEPQPFIGGMMKGMQDMMGGAHKMMGRMMGGGKKGGKKGGKMFPDIGKMMSGMMERKQKMIGGMMAQKQKMMSQMMSKFSSFGGKGGKKGH